MPRAADPTAAPDPRLLAAAAMVFVEHPATPELDAAGLHHLLDVRRLGDGDRVVAADGAGSWAPCRLTVARGGGGGRLGRSAGLVADGPVARQERTEPAVAVAFAPAKGDRSDWAVQKLTELGVDRIVLTRTARSVVRWEGERADRATGRLRRVAREAAAQCRRPWLPEVLGPAGLDDLEVLLGGPACLARPGGAAPSLDRPAVVVGPEGGWAESELERFPRTVGLGPTVLRAETAAVVAGTLLCGLRSGIVLPTLA